MKIVVCKEKKQWYWKIVARNGRILAHSETYSRQLKAIKTANLIARLTGLNVTAK